MPIVAPIIRAVLSIPDAVPERACGTVATATPLTGLVLRPRPMPTINSAPAISQALVSGPTNASRIAPTPMQAMPPVMDRSRGQRRWSCAPVSCDTTTKLTDIGSICRPATSAGSHRARSESTAASRIAVRTCRTSSDPATESTEENSRLRKNSIGTRRAVETPSHNAKKATPAISASTAIDRIGSEVQPQCVPSIAAKANPPSDTMASAWPRRSSLRPRGAELSGTAA